ncbi:hypothetical protein [Salinispora vitiensis]|uniref:hypothetical protein n=1 Tax=Salinispora vitiensis TaxID=999544 RepID=UPI0003A1736A
MQGAGWHPRQVFGGLDEIGAEVEGEGDWASANSARSSRRQVGQGQAALQPAQFQIGMTGPWVVTAHRRGSGP